MLRVILIVEVVFFVACMAFVWLAPSGPSIRETRAKRFTDHCTAHDFREKQCAFLYALKRDREDDDDATDAAIEMLLNGGKLQP